jgi:hypothetical protein
VHGNSLSADEYYLEAVRLVPTPFVLNRYPIERKEKKFKFSI